MESFIDHNNKSINLLIRILGLEKLNSYSNRAVTGGLDEFLINTFGPFLYTLLKILHILDCLLK